MTASDKFWIFTIIGIVCYGLAVVYLPLLGVEEALVEDIDILLLIFAGMFCWVWVSWYIPILGVHPMVRDHISQRIMIWSPILCAASLWLILITIADTYVRTHFEYQLLYFVIGMAWLGAGKWFINFLGFSPFDDGLQRRNPSAALAIGGALFGIMFCFAGGNIGEGPGSWVVLLSATFSTVGFFVCWMLLEGFTHISETVTIERDLAAGLRLAAYLMTIGLVLGQAVSGNWISFDDLVWDFFRRGWMALAITAFAAFIESFSRPTVERLQPSVSVYGIAPAAAYFATALIVLNTF